MSSHAFYKAPPNHSEDYYYPFLCHAYAFKNGKFGPTELKLKSNMRILPYLSRRQNDEFV